jgi:hypothetical protein
MKMRLRDLLGGGLLAAGLATPAMAAGLPQRVGQCVETRIKQVTTRLEGAADSGSAVEFDNEGYQVSYDRVPAVDNSRAGDPVTLCLVSIPKGCPPGDNRGRRYRATNKRTHQRWTLPDAEHMCGGA